MPLTRRAFFRTLFAASQAGLAGRLMAGQTRDDFSGALNFAIIGDWGRHGRPDQRAVAQQMALACENARASFVISVGDNFYEDGVSSVHDQHWTSSFEDVYTAPSLQVPWHVTLGNHDYRGHPEAQLDYGKTHPRWKMPARYYTQAHLVDASTNLEFFHLDTSPVIGEYQLDPMMWGIHSQNTGHQLAWLDQALAASKAPWKIVVGHHPIYSAGWGHGSEKEMIRLVLPILRKHGVQAYFCGHDHDLQHLKTGDLHLIVSGGGSEHRPVRTIAETEFSRGVSGFALASVRSNEMQVRLIDDRGALLYTALVPRSVTV